MVAVAAGTPYRRQQREQLRDLLLDAAAARCVTGGWASLTMNGLAEDVGVSRQTVYNEFGSKTKLAEHLVMRELGRLLDVVRAALATTTELVPAIRTACTSLLVAAEQNPLVRAILESAHTGTGDDMLPLLTTRASDLLDTARAVVLASLGETGHVTGLDPVAERETVDCVVRLVLSHVMQPSGSPEQDAAKIARLFGATLAGYAATSPPTSPTPR